LFLLLIHCLFAVPAWADVADKYNVTLGGNVTTFDSHIAIKSQDDSIDKEIDLEDDLGFDSSLRAGWLSASWRVAERHRIRFTYSPIRRTSTKTLLRDIDVGDNTIKAGASADSSVRTEVYDVSYIYSFYKTPKWEYGVSAGLYWMDNRTEIEAQGVIVSDIDGTEEISNEFKVKQSFTAPLPLVGLMGSYELNSKVRFGAHARYLDVEISNIQGRILSLALRADYYFTKHLGAGLSLATFDLDVRQEGIVFNNELSWDYTGTQLFLAYRY